MPILHSLGYGLVWDLLGILAALSVWPAARAALPATLAWGVARLIAPIAIAYVTILPSLILPQAVFTRASVAVSVVSLAGVCWARFRGRLPAARDAWRFEAIYGVFLLLGCLFVPFIASLEPTG